MAVFTPPTDNFFSLAEFDVSQPWSANKRFAFNLLKHYRSEPRGRNVYKLSDGTYVENEPEDYSTVVFTYYGGHDWPVDAAEVVALTAAGYGDYIS